MDIGDLAGSAVGNTNGSLPPIGTVRQSRYGDPTVKAAVRHGELLGLISVVVVAGTVSILAKNRAPLVIGLVGFGAVALVYEHAYRKEPM